MPNMLASVSQRCTLTNVSGQPCGSPARRGFPYCAFHDPNRKAVAARFRSLRDQRTSGVTTDSPLNDLLRLDPSTSENLRTLTLGLMQHVGAGTIDHQSAASILRFARSAAELTPRRRDDSMKNMLSNLLSTKPTPDSDEEDHGPDVSRETPPPTPGD